MEILKKPEEFAAELNHLGYTVSEFMVDWKRGKARWPTCPPPTSSTWRSAW